MQQELTFHVFSKPEGNVAGTGYGSVKLGNGKLCRVHVLLLTDELPEIKVTMPSKLSPADLAQSMTFIQRFESQLHDLVAQHGLPSGDATPSTGIALRKSAEALVRHHLDSVDVHPCDEYDDDVRAQRCLPEVRSLYAALKE